MISRFYNENEHISENAGLQRKCEFYASRFAAKEAFSKALGTGIRGFNLNEVFISKDDNEKPEIKVLGNAKKFLKKNVVKNIKSMFHLAMKKNMLWRSL